MGAGGGTLGVDTLVWHASSPHIMAMDTLGRCLLVPNQVLIG